MAKFKYENKTQKPIKITSVKSSCGCTVASLEKEEVAPGEKGEVTATFKIGGRTGMQQKSITVTTDDASQPVVNLLLKAMIAVPLEIQPSFVYWEQWRGAEAQNDQGEGGQGCVDYQAGRDLRRSGFHHQSRQRRCARRVPDLDHAEGHDADAELHDHHQVRFPADLFRDRARDRPGGIARSISKSLGVNRTVLSQALALLGLAFLPAIGQALYLGSTVSWHAPAVAKDEVTLDEATTWGDTVMWLDARPDAQFVQQHIPGATQLNEDRWNELLPEMLKTWSPDKRVVVYCSSQSCAASHEVARRLRDEAQLKNVFVLHGGWEAWLDKQG